VVPNTHEEIEEVVMRALAREPKNRFNSGSDMRDAIVGIMIKQYGGPPSPRELGNLMRDLFPAEMKESQALYEESRRYKRMPEDAPPLAPEEDSSPDSDSAEPVADTVPSGRDPGTSTTVDPVSPPEPEPQLTEDTPVSPGPPEAMTAAMEAESEEVGRRATANVPGPRFVGSAQPTAVTKAYPGRSRWRDLLIVLGAIVVAGGLVLATWLGTRGTGVPEQGGAVIITVPEGASVVIDGVQVGTTPYSSPALTEGSHIVTLKMDGFLLARREITVVPGKVVELRVPLVRAP
jgi:hypothetical protein